MIQTKTNFKFFRGYTEVIVGWKGRSFLDTGIIYAPYIPVYNTDSFTPNIGIVERYARTMVRPEYYGTIHIT
jgi:hypothetical protein